MEKKSRAFTVLELMVAVLILTIVVSLASVGYQKYRDRAAMLVDETNQKIILAAVKLYAYDNNALPGSLSQLQDRDLKRAYVLVTDGKRPYTVLAFLREQLSLFDIAEAAPLPARYLGDNRTQRLTCPLGGPVGLSYGIDPDARGQSLQWMLSHPTARIIFETDASGNLARRHEGGRTCVTMLASGTPRRDRLERPAGSGSTADHQDRDKERPQEGSPNSSPTTRHSSK